MTWNELARVRLTVCTVLPAGALRATRGDDVPSLLVPAPVVFPVDVAHVPMQHVSAPFSFSPSPTAVSPA